jgi:hypothetical protein
MRRTGIDLQYRAFHEFDGKPCGSSDRHNLVIVAMQDESGNVDLFQIFGEVGFVSCPSA